MLWREVVLRAKQFGMAFLEAFGIPSWLRQQRSGRGTTIAREDWMETGVPHANALAKKRAKYQGPKPCSGEDG